MYFKIDYDKVSEVGKIFQNKSEELDSLYNDVLKICDRIDENYRSEESTIYTSKYQGYVRRFANENVLLSEGGKVLDRTSSLYGNQEESWANKVMQSELNEGDK